MTTNKSTLYPILTPFNLPNVPFRVIDPNELPTTYRLAFEEFFIWFICTASYLCLSA